MPNKKPKTLSKNSISEKLNFGDNHFEMRCEMNKVVKKGKLNAITSITIFCEI
jgi:hypothetical protein